MSVASFASVPQASISLALSVTAAAELALIMWLWWQRRWVVHEALFALLLQFAVNFTIFLSGNSSSFYIVLASQVDLSSSNIPLQPVAWWRYMGWLWVAPATLLASVSLQSRVESRISSPSIVFRLSAANLGKWATAAVQVMLVCGITSCFYSSTDSAHAALFVLGIGGGVAALACFTASIVRTAVLGPSSARVSLALLWLLQCFTWSCYPLIFLLSYEGWAAASLPYSWAAVAYGATDFFAVNVLLLVVYYVRFGYIDHPASESLWVPFAAEVEVQTDFDSPRLLPALHEAAASARGVHARGPELLDAEYTARALAVAKAAGAKISTLKSASVKRVPELPPLGPAVSSVSGPSSSPPAVRGGRWATRIEDDGTLREAAAPSPTRLVVLSAEHSAPRLSPTGFATGAVKSPRDVTPTSPPVVSGADARLPSPQSQPSVSRAVTSASQTSVSASSSRSPPPPAAVAADTEAAIQREMTETLQRRVPRAGGTRHALLSQVFSDTEVMAWGRRLAALAPAAAVAVPVVEAAGISGRTSGRNSGASGGGGREVHERLYADALARGRRLEELLRQAQRSLSSQQQQQQHAVEAAAPGRTRAGSTSSRASATGAPTSLAQDTARDGWGGTVTVAVSSLAGPEAKSRWFDVPASLGGAAGTAGADVLSPASARFDMYAPSGSITLDQVPPRAVLSARVATSRSVGPPPAAAVVSQSSARTSRLSVSRHGAFLGGFLPGVSESGKFTGPQ